jgi:hypothetical protein
MRIGVLCVASLILVGTSATVSAWARKPPAHLARTAGPVDYPMQLQIDIAGIFWSR